MKERTGISSMPDQDGTDIDENRADPAMADRLREAVTAAGGPSAVARTSGVSLRSLNNYLTGREMKRRSLVAIARACGVRLEWLATGAAPMRPDEKPIAFRQAGSSWAAPRLDAPPRNDPGTFGTLSMEILAAAVEITDKAIALRQLAPTPRQKAQMISLFYDMVADKLRATGEPEATAAIIDEAVKSNDGL